MSPMIPFIKTKYSRIFLLFVSLFLANISLGQGVVTPPTGTWTVPAGVTSVKIEAWGGGGNGGVRGGVSFLGYSSGGGGGGGGYRVHTYSGLVAGSTFTITIGAGGQNTTVARSGQTNLVAAGGNNGSNGSTFSTGNGGAGGGTGSGPSGSTGVGGSAGSNGNSSGAGGNGGNGATANGGAGGTGGANGGGNNAGPAGVPGGGGGGANNDGSNASGGASGRVIISYTCPLATISYPSSAFCISATSAAVTINGSTGGTFSVIPSSGLTINGSGLINPSTSTVGTYTVHYQFAGGNNCSAVDATATVKINPLPVATVPNQTNISCFGSVDGTITVSAGTGSSPYTFSIDNGANYFPATGSDLRQFTGLLPDILYQIKVKDANGCISN